MKSIINRVLAMRERPALSPAGIFPVSSELSTADLENYYLRIVIDCLRRMLVSVDTIEVEVKRTSDGPEDAISFTGYVRILKWDPVVTPVLLQNMPVIDGRVRKVAGASVILESTHFAGLWFLATSAVEGSPKSLMGLPCELVHQPGGPAN
jgi:hypothetical protein